MKLKTKSAAVVATGITAFMLFGAFSHADSPQYAETVGLNTQLNEAVSLALTQVDGALIEAELELEDDQSIWEIEIVDEANQIFSVEVDALSGEIVHTESSDDIAPSLSNVISMEQAIELVKALDNGTLIEVELEEEDDQLVWEIETLSEDNQESEVRIDGMTGEILQ